MFFTKFPHSANFSFARKFDAKTAIASAGEHAFSVRASSFRGGIHRLQIIDPAVPDNGCLTQLSPPEPCDCHPLKLDTSFALTVTDGEGNPILRSSRDGFGVSGEAWMFQFNVVANSRFYGMGEKNFGRLELSGIRTKFWNTDVWGDFHFAQWLDHPSDPPYLSIPYVIVKQGNTYVGLLVHSAYPVFM